MHAKVRHSWGAPPEKMEIRSECSRADDARDSSAAVLCKAEAVLWDHARSRRFKSSERSEQSQAHDLRPAGASSSALAWMSEEHGSSVSPCAGTDRARACVILSPRALFSKRERSPDAGRQDARDCGAAVLARAEAVLWDHAQSRADRKANQARRSRVGGLRADTGAKRVLSSLLHQWRAQGRANRPAVFRREQPAEQARNLLDEAENFLLAKEAEEQTRRDEAGGQKARALRQRHLAKAMFSVFLKAVLSSRDLEQRVLELSARRGSAWAWQWWVKALAAFRDACLAQARAAERRVKLEALVRGFSTSGRRDACALKSKAQTGTRVEGSAEARAGGRQGARGDDWSAGRGMSSRASACKGQSTRASSATRKAAVVCEQETCGGCRHDDDDNAKDWCACGSGREAPDAGSHVPTSAPEAHSPGSAPGGRSHHASPCPVVSADCRTRAEAACAKTASGANRRAEAGQGAGDGTGGRRDDEDRGGAARLDASAQHASVISMQQRELARKAARLALKVGW